MLRIHYQAWRDFFESILIAVFLALFVRTFLFTGYRVTTNTMAPQLLPGDFILSYRLPLGVKIPLSDAKIAWGAPDRGEVVVFTEIGQPRTAFVRRVVGLTGDRVEIKKGQLRVNDKVLSDKLPADLAWGPLIVAEDEAFLVSDNLSSSENFFSSVPLKRIEGKALLIWLSLDWQRKLMRGFPGLRSDRIFKVIQ